MLWIGSKDDNLCNLNAINFYDEPLSPFHFYLFHIPLGNVPIIRCNMSENVEKMEKNIYVSLNEEIYV